MEVEAAAVLSALLALLESLDVLAAVTGFKTVDAYDEMDETARIDVEPSSKMDTPLQDRPKA